MPNFNPLSRLIPFIQRLMARIPTNPRTSTSQLEVSDVFSPLTIRINLPVDDRGIQAILKMGNTAENITDAQKKILEELTHYYLGMRQDYASGKKTEAESVIQSTYRRATPEELNKLTSESALDAPTCLICLDEMTEKAPGSPHEPITVLKAARMEPCHPTRPHIFHRECISSWIFNGGEDDTRPTQFGCPTCRGIIISDAGFKALDQGYFDFQQMMPRLIKLTIENENPLEADWKDIAGNVDEVTLFKFIDHLRHQGHEIPTFGCLPS